jgi:bifunctional non-homologous end joining protein LigD
MAAPKKTKKLAEYDRKRDFQQTPEPSGAKRDEGDAEQARFVIQEHHATSLHWDLRLERNGVFVSWAVPKGIPPDPKKNHLAVHVEDHPLDYGDFEGEIPKGNYGAGKVKIWDRGTYETHKFRKDEVIVTFHGERVEGKYVLFQTKGKNWMIHRMDPPKGGDREPMPETLVPMLAKLSKLPASDDGWGYEIKWDGIRALAFIDGGRIRLVNRNGRDATKQYPELRELGKEVGPQQLILDGEIVAFDEQGRPSSFWTGTPPCSCPTRTGASCSTGASSRDPAGAPPPTTRATEAACSRRVSSRASRASSPSVSTAPTSRANAPAPG